MAEVNQNISIVNKRRIGETQNNVECKMTASDQKILGVLAVTPRVEVTGCEMLVGEATVSGKVVIDILYRTEDDGIDSMLSAFAFSTKVESKEIAPNLACVALANVEDCVLDGVSEDEVRFVVTTSISVLGYPEQVLEIAKNKEDCCVKMSQNSATLISNKSNQKLSDTLTLDIKDKIKKVLKVDVQTICKDVQAGSGYVSANGEDLVDVLYVEDDVEPKLKSVSFVLPFSEEFEVGGVTKESIVDVFVSQKFDALTNTLEQGEDSAKIIVNREANVQMFAFEKREFETIEDIYSLTHTTLVSTNSYEYFVPNRKLFFQNKIEGMITAGEDMPRIDKVLQNTGNTLKVVSSFVQDDEIMIQGTMQTTVLYLNDENSSIESIEVEIPFEVKQRIDEDQNNSMLDVCCVVGGVDVVAKRGKDIFVEAEIKSYVSISSTKTDAAITSVELQDELPQKTSAMEIYFASVGQTLWDVAKDMLEDVATLSEFNPDLPEVMTGDEKIVCYRKKSLNF